MKPSSKRTLKKAFLNITAGLCAIVFTGNVIAGECAGQINSALGTATSKVVSTLAEGETEGYARYFESKYNSIAELKAAGEAKVREVEGEGIVLLKNDNNVLPLKEGSDVALVGVTILDPVYGGTGSGAVDANGAANYYDVMTQAGYNVVDKALLDYYVEKEAKRNAHEIGEIKWSKVKKNNGDTIGNGEDVIFVVGRVGGEGNDVTVTIDDTLDDDYLKLNENELSILEGLKELKDDGKIRSITMIINSANPMSVGFLNDEAYGVDAALWVGSVGQTGIYAVGDVISGKTNPSGSLPDTWWVDNQLNPVQNNFGSYTYADANNFDLGTNANKFNQYVVYQEGIYVGYKYTETRYEDVVMGTPNAGDFNYNSVVGYPFGFGLSYTSFSFSDMQVEKTGEGRQTSYDVSVKVTNTGAVAGKKTVQVYAQKPYTEYDKQNGIEKAAVELAGYGKTAILQPGESEVVKVNVPEYFLTSYDATGTGVYILDEGHYYLTVADDSHAAANNILAAKGMTTENGMTAAGDASLTYGMDYTFDAETYAASYGTGSEVKSLFADADVNRYEGSGDNSVVYYSRSNWAGTVTSGPVQLAMTAQIAADAKLDDSDLPDATGMEFPTMGVSVNLQLVNMMDYDYDDPQWDIFMDQLTYEQMAKLCANGLRMTINIDAIGKPLTVDHNGPSGVTQKYSVGENGYAVQTNDPQKDIKGTCYPCNGIIAATFNDELIREVGELIGEDAMWAGYAGLYGTGLNIHRSPYAGRVFEYYSEDGTLTGLVDAAETLGIQSKGVYVYNKHFVLNDQENNRAGIATWVNEQALRENYLRAFELPIVNADAKCVMTAFNRLGAQWAGAYTELLTDWLRGEAGMEGFAVTDMYDDTYMVKANEVVAGNDIPDNYVGDDISQFAAYGPNGTTPNAAVAQALRTSSKRVLYTVLHSRGMDGISSNTQIVSVTPWWQMTLNVVQWTLTGLTALALLLLLLDMAPRKKKKA
ncbi:MAG: glycoside hydrolase family 3 C-terminal domain-containing protein [Clostridiales bacterium]|nr:glycoside hydrolase family 3 C-terminal domain-containing protein [Clostridiales bacterium]